MNIILPRLLPLVEVAECCRVSPHTVRKWVREGKLRPVRLCRRLLFHPDDVARLLSEASRW
jgi:excisionase family DNA binding protein